MASENSAVGTQHTASGSNHDLWINGGKAVLTVALNKECKAFPPHGDLCGCLNKTIQGLARAAKAVVFHAQNDPSVATEFAMQPIDDIVDAITLLSQLSEAIREELEV